MVITNHHYREILFGHELPEQELNWWRTLVDFPEEEKFFKYKNNYYYLNEFMTFNDSNWDGYLPQSAFSGILIKLSQDCQYVKVALSIN